QVPPRNSPVCPAQSPKDPLQAPTSRSSRAPSKSPRDRAHPANSPSPGGQSAPAQQRWVQHIRPVRRRDDDNPFMGIESVHLLQQRVQSLLALVVATAKAVTAAPTHSVDFINENQARGVFPRLLEHIAHTACAYADKHLHEI